jgi:ribosomal-protein-alanine N-acetyltransferase
MLLETNRLQLHKMTIEDAPFILELVNTPAWHQYIGDRGIKTIEQAQKYIETSYLESYTNNGFGAYVMIDKNTETKIGTCGLYVRPDLDHPDIGFALLPEFTKKGYAYEATNALMDYAKNNLGIMTILAITIKENSNSIALLEKVGLRKIDTITLKGDKTELFLFSN